MAGLGLFSWVGLLGWVGLGLQVSWALFSLSGLLQFFLACSRSAGLVQGVGLAWGLFGFAEVVRLAWGLLGLFRFVRLPWVCWVLWVWGWCQNKGPRNMHFSSKPNCNP